jgi:hypothetical protein
MLKMRIKKAASRSQVKGHVLSRGQLATGLSGGRGEDTIKKTPLKEKVILLNTNRPWKMLMTTIHRQKKVWSQMREELTKRKKKGLVKGPDGYLVAFL